MSMKLAPHAPIVTETFAAHLMAQLQSAPAATDAERARAIAVATARTESSTGVVLSAADVAALVLAAASIGITKRDAYGTRVGEADFTACTRLLEERGLSAVAVLANVKTGLGALRTLIKPGASKPVKQQLDALEAAEVSPGARARLHQLLAAEPFDAAAAVGFLGAELGATEIMREWMGTKENTSLGTHTQEVIERYLAERPHHDVHAPVGVRLEPMLRFALVLHDIGKPAAVESGDRDAQHAFTTPVLSALARKFGFSEQETTIMRALVDNDAVGAVVNPSVARDIEDAAAELKALARECGMEASAYFGLQALFYTADAGSYRFLVERAFTKDERGALVSKSPRFDALREAVAS